MLPTWVPEITFGNAITITLVTFVYLDLRMRVTRNLEMLRKNNDIATLAAGHAKLTFDNSATVAANLRIAVADTKTEIAAAVVSITAAAADAAAMHTPVATKLPPELRVTIAKELKTSTPAGQ